MIREPRSLSGNQAMTLDAATRPGLLVSGSLAVFAVDRETGERVPLFSLAAGEPVLPIACPPDAPFRVMAISLEPSHIEAADDDPDWKVIFALENWLAKMGEAVSQFCP